MGACYYVRYELYKKDATECESALKKYLKGVKIEHKGQSFDELIQTVLLADRKYTDYEKRDENCHCSSFDASYMYEVVLGDAFYAMAPHLADGSTAFIEPDEYSYTIIVKDGRCIDTRDGEIKNLRKEDLVNVEKIDELSGFNVAQWLEDLGDNEEADSCFGIFYDDELIGYCTLGYASGAIEIETECDDVLLSDVYIKKEWRHMNFGSKLVREVTEGLDDNCYLTFLHDGLEEFYNAFEFEKVEGTDNVMVKYCD